MTGQNNEIDAMSDITLALFGDKWRKKSNIYLSIVVKLEQIVC